MPDDPVALLHVAAMQPAALGKLAETEQPRLLAWLRRVLRDDDLAEEAAQEAWLILSQGNWRFHAHTHDPLGDMRAWLRQIALNAAWRQLERQRRHGRHVSCHRQRSQAEEVTPLDRLAERDRNELVWALVAELPSPMRATLELRFREGLDFAAVGRAQGCSALTARVRAWRAVAHLRRRLAPLGLLALRKPLLAALSDGNCGTSLTASLPVAASALVRFALGIAGVATAIAIGVCLYRISTNSSEGRFPRANTDALASEPAISGHTVTEGQSSTPWLYRERESDALTVARTQSSDGFVPPAEKSASGPQVVLEMHFLQGGGAIRGYSTTKATLLTASERASLLTSPDIDLVMEPRVVVYSGQHAHVSSPSQYAYVAGYTMVGISSAKNASLKVLSPDPVIQVLNTGNATEVSAVVENSSIRITCAHMEVSRQRDKQERQVLLPRGDYGSFTYPWEEFDVSRASSVPLPTDGMLVPMECSILLPVVSDNTLQHIAPNGIRSINDPDSPSPSWLLVTPTVAPADSSDIQAPAHEPELPGSRG